MSQLSIFAVSSALAGHANARHDAISRNIANADTPGYRAVDVAEFSAENTSGFALRATRPGHVLSDPQAAYARIPAERAETAQPDGNNVGLEEEMALAAEARLTHQLALGVYRSSLDILRATLGRRS